MNGTTTKLAGELAFCGFLGGIGVLALSGLEGLTKSPFDYLGSAEVPRALAWALIGLAVLVAVNVVASAIVSASRETEANGSIEDDIAPDEPGVKQAWQVAVMIVATLLYVLSILWSAIPYSVSTSVFLIVGMLVLTPARQRKPAIILPLSVGIGALGEYVFVSVLLLPFPGW